MADNVTDGSGNTFATDQIGAVHYPKEKLVFGADDAFTDVTTSAGLPVNVVAGVSTLATTAKQDTGNTSLASIDGKITAVNTGAVVISSGSVTADTELPAAAALADNTANPTVPAVGSFLMAFDGTNWDRVQTGAAATGSLKVDGSAVTQPVSIGATVTVDSELPAAAALADNTANPTVPAVGAFLMAFDGTNWDRVLTGSATNGAIKVDLVSTTANAVAVKVDNSAVTQPISAASLPLPSGASTAANQTNVQIVDNAGFTDGTTTLQMAGFIFDDTAGTAVTENDAVAARVDVKRALVGVLEDATTRGNRANVKAASTAPIATDLGLVVALSPNMSTLAGALAKAEDSGHVTADVGVMALGVRKDAPMSASTSADADYSQLSTDSAGVVWIRQKEITSYAAAYRLAEVASGQHSLSFTFVTNTNKQLATIYHTGAATKIVKIRRVELIVVKGQPGIYSFELRALSAATAPATGNPAITPRQYDPADAAVEATCLALPTTAGSLVGTNTGTVGAVVELDGDALGPPPGRYMLYEYDSTRHVKPLIMRSGTAEGYAVNGRCTAPSTLRYTVLIEFTEE